MSADQQLVVCHGGFQLLLGVEFGDVEQLLGVRQEARLSLPAIGRGGHRAQARLGAVYGPYTGTCFASTTETDIEHIVAACEAHDSGLCAADAETRARFARDLRNLTLASPRVNRHQKSGKDAVEWVPARNRCWFAARIH